ncbi:probable glutamate receptor isoform X2 [Tenebrio molitor]
MICLSENDLYVSFRSTRNFMKIAKTLIQLKTAIVLFVDDINANNYTYFFNEEVSKLAGDSLRWLIMTNEIAVVDKFRFTTLSLDADLVIAVHVSFSRNKDMESPVIFGNQSEIQNICSSLSYNKTNISFLNNSYVSPQVILPYLQDADLIYQLCLSNSSNSSYCLLQLYKIRKESNMSLAVHVLGSWNSLSRMENLSPFVVVEKRVNLHHFPLKFGKQNATEIDMVANTIEDDCCEEKFLQIANYFQHFFNANIEIVHFQKLGHRENDGKWTDLLGAIVNQEVDLGLASVIKTQERYSDMAFTHKILTSMRNIYIKHQQSTELRDIFLIPFGSKLILCVIVTGMIFCIMTAITNKVANRITKRQNNDTLGEATVWCIAIFTMQGSTWTPTTYSGNIILIISLAFALVIFNSYSAFITSILSVEIASIRSVEDLLESNYNIGYVKNSQDEIYLRSINDTQLQQIYLRGYLHNTVVNVTHGLLKSHEGYYGFFASTIKARKELQIVNNYKCNSDIVEIPVEKTKNAIAFPLAKMSPYRKIFDLSIIKMYETGMYKYFHSLIISDLPKCEDRRIFRSAHLPDLSSAFGILIIGIQLSLIIAIAECLWKRKRKIRHVIKKKFSCKNNLAGHDQSNEKLSKQIHHPYQN